jgi:hypothetical protein
MIASGLPDAGGAVHPTLFEGKVVAERAEG